MKCERCGTEFDAQRDPDLMYAGDHAPWFCRDALAAQLADLESVMCSYCMTRSHNTAEHELAAGAGLDIVESLRAQLAAERAKSARLATNYKSLNHQLAVASQKRDAALAAQKAAEERAERLIADRQACTGHLVHPEYTSCPVHDRWAHDAPQAPAAEPEGSGK